MGGSQSQEFMVYTDAGEDVIASVPLMKRLAEEIYRKLRNTFRFLLANLDGFEPAKDEQPWAQMEPLDQYMLARTAELVEKVRKAYEEFELHRVFHALNEFCNSELSAFYIDLVKYVIYTLAPKDTRRLSAQTALWKITEALVRLVAPILSFTADEVWSYMPEVSGREKSVHIAHFPIPQELAPANDFSKDWEILLQTRENLLRAFEPMRVTKEIGKSLDLQLEFIYEPNEASRIPGGYVQTYIKYRDSLPELLGVSRVDLRQGAVSHPSHRHLVEYRKTVANGVKCERCWRYTGDVGDERRYPTVCLRCADALEKIGFPPFNEEEEKAA